MTFHYKRSSLSYFGGVCSRIRGVGVNEVNFMLSLTSTLSLQLISFFIKAQCITMNFLDDDIEDVA